MVTPKNGPGQNGRPPRGRTLCYAAAAISVPLCYTLRWHWKFIASSLGIFSTGEDQEPKKHPNQTFWGNFVDRKVWGNFGQWGSKKSLGVQGLQSHFFHYGGHAPPP